MWERKIHHNGLKLYRVVHGATKGEAELKAALQLALWEERWTKKQSSLLSKNESLKRALAFRESKGVAQLRTEELRERTATFETILKGALD
jgi:hypothetical protein